MEEYVKTPADYLAMIKRQKWWIVGTVATIIVLSAGVAVGLPSIYKSTATILIEQQEIPKDLVQSSVTSYADQRIQIISQRVMTRSNLIKIINKYNLYTDMAENTPIESIIDKLREDITMEMISADVIDPRSGRPSQATIAFSLAYKSRSPNKAQEVANELVSLYLNENLESRTRQATETSDFISQEVKRLGEIIAKLETKIAKFKEVNAGSLPELITMNQQLMDRSERELLEVDRQIRSLKEREIYLNSELSQINPYSTLYSQSGERILSTSDRLKSLQSEYVTKSAIYGPNMPDLIKMRKEISALKKQVGSVVDIAEMNSQLDSYRGEMASLSLTYSKDHPDVISLERKIVGLQLAIAEAYEAKRNSPAAATEPDNPAYIQIQAQLFAADSDIRSLSERRVQLNAKLTQYENRLIATPQSERQLRMLTRDYDNAQLKYKELKAKEMQAQLSEALESERKGERMVLIEPPQLPEKPIKPNRMAILFLGLVFSLGGGFGMGMLRDGLASCVNGVKDVVAVLGGIPPLATISYIETETTVQNTQTKKIIVIATIIVGIIVVLLFIHFLFKPLDVLWFSAMRKVGI